MVKRKSVKAASPGKDVAPHSEEAGSVLPRRSGSLVFISHDSRDADLAEAFANLLTDVSAGMLKSFRSSDKRGTTGIEFGTEWYKAIMSQLEDATDVVALLTPRSVDRPWILYEAGVAKGKLDTNVLGIALGVPLEKVSTGPFGQFQNCGDDEDSLTKLVLQLLSRNPDANPREEAIRRQVQAFRENIAKLNKGRTTPAGSAQAEEGNVAKLFEEVKAMVRELPDRLDDKVKAFSGKAAIRQKRYHPMLIDDIAASMSRELPDGDIQSILFLLSFIREDYPWVADYATKFVTDLRSSSSSGVDNTDQVRNFMSFLEFTTRHPAMRELGRGYSREDELNEFILRRMLPRAIDQLLTTSPSAGKKPVFHRLRMPKAPDTPK